MTYLESAFNIRGLYRKFPNYLNKLFSHLLWSLRVLSPSKYSSLLFVHGPHCFYQFWNHSWNASFEKLRSTVSDFFLIFSAGWSSTSRFCHLSLSVRFSEKLVCLQLVQLHTLRSGHVLSSCWSHVLEIKYHSLGFTHWNRQVLKFLLDVPHSEFCDCTGCTKTWVHLWGCV